MCALARTFAVHLALSGRRCLVVGGGEVGWRKARALADCGALVTVVGERFSAALRRTARVTRVRRRFRPSDLRGVWLVVAATDDRALNQAVAREANRRGLLVNVVDEPGAGNFIVPAQFRRGRLTVSISTEGASPLLARKVKERLGRLLDETYARWLRLLAEFRPRAQARVRSARARRRFFDELTSARVYRILKREGLAAGRRYARQALERPAEG
jgi:precorrin-2 dehydrogenase/sirohydrochlorin ferrochelatase